MMPGKHLLVPLCLSIIFLHRCNAQDTGAMLTEWSNSIDASFVDIRKYMKINYLSGLTSGYSRGTYNDATAQTLLDNIVKDMEAVVNKRVTTVEKLSTSSEKYHIDTTNDLGLSCTNFTYYRAKAITGNETFANSQNSTELCQRFRYANLTDNPLLYNLGVNQSFSTAHIPTNVYDGSKAILMVANWTKKLDKDFVDNKKNDASLKWQYFGSSEGLLKIYPGVKWYVQINQFGGSYPVDFFDCRSLNWYLMASSCPKSVVLIVDKSGSMTGKRVIIANRTITEILLTLTENDEFNVIHINNTAPVIDPAYNDSMIQASKRNVHRVVHLLNLQAKGIANYSLGLIKGLELLSKTPAGYAKALFVLGDGLPSSYDNIFKQYDKSIRVFAYLIGKHATDSKYMRNIACNNNGYFAHIMTLSDVKENVLKYLPVISRIPKPASTTAIKRFTAWTGPHVREVLGRVFQPAITKNVSNSSVTVAAKVLQPNALFISVSRAAYDLKINKSKNFYPLLGVAGLDIPLSTLERLTRKWSLGPSGYVFMINNNGYVVFHPNYRPTYNGHMKPFFQDTDLSRAEHPVGATEVNGQPNYDMTIRQGMIDRTAGNGEMKIFSIPDDFKSAFEMTNKYFYKPLPKTPYTIALALKWSSTSSESYLTTPTASINIGDFTSWLATTCPGATSNHSGIALVPYEFCTFNDAAATEYQKDPICGLKYVINTPSHITAMSCDTDFINRVQRDATTSREIYTQWTTDYSKWASTYDIDQAFLLFHSGLLKYYNQTTPRDPQFIAKHSQKAMNDELFQTTFMYSRDYGKKDLLYFHVPTPAVSKVNSSITVTGMVYVTGTTVPVAVSGLQISYDKLKTFFTSTTDKSTSCTTCKFCNSSNVDCYLLTTNGYIVISNRNSSDAGLFLAQVDASVMQSMLKNHVFSTKTVFDFQAICNASAGTTSFGVRLIDPISHFLGYIINLVCAFTIFVLQMCLTLLWTLVSYAEVNPTYNVTSTPAWNSCGFTETIYSWNTSATSTTFQINCAACNSNCTKKEWTAKQIGNTNLVLLHVFTSESNCQCSCGSGTKTSEKLAVNRSLLISMKRKPPVWQHNDAVVAETGAVCGSSNNLLSSKSLLASGLLTFIFLMQHYG